ncbi:hypothetical protein [Novosphingobium sp. YAF33]|jgi:hypothetical protein|uniref:hypothetical protein n=1 Tax=Novosphingobium sp. YAF33 TaxID=3233082 RepID=UPI0010CF8E6D|nr:hypothetical protein EDF57_11231 [Novosphingobium sp. PhB55]
MMPDRYGHAVIGMARSFVSGYLEAAGRADLSHMVRAGEGDDFPEVRAAVEMLSVQADVLRRYEEALGQYADPGFWDEATPGGALALHDSGQMARNVLGGRPPFFHRD